MQNRNTLIAVGIIAAGLLALILVYRTAVETPAAPPAPQTVQSVAPPQQAGPLQKTDEGGNTWVLTLASGQSSSGAADGAAGPLVTVKADVQRRGANEATIGLILAGAGGELYQPVVTKNGVRLPAPGLKIVNEQGDVLAEGKFQYG